MIHIENTKKDFPIFTNAVQNGVPFTFLDNAAASQTPRQVVDAEREYYECYKANVHSGIYTIGARAVAAYESARAHVARFISAFSEEIVFTSGTTASLNMVCQMLGKTLHEGDEVIVSAMEHHSNFIPWQQLSKEKKLRFTVVPLERDGSLSIELMRTRISKTTKVVAITHASHAIGVVNDVTEICRLSHDKGAVCVVDAAQSAPHMPIDVRAMDCDFLAFSGQKMLGPTGTGVLYGRKDLLETMQPAYYGGGMIREVNVDESHWADVPAKFEAGTPNVAGVVGLDKAIEYLTCIGMEAVRAHEKELTQYALERVGECPGVTLFGSRDMERRTGIISFLVDGVHPHDTAEVLAQGNIAVRAGHHCAMPLMRHLGVPGTVRASFYIYNTKEDVDRLIDGIVKVKELFQK